MSRAAKTTPEERFEAFVRLAKRLKRAGRDAPTRADRKQIASEFDVSEGTIRSWMCREPDAWQRAGELAGLFPESEPSVATSGSSGQAGGGSAVVAGPSAAAGLTPQQAEACRLRTLGNKTQAETAAVVKVHADTVGVWERTLPAWAAYRTELDEARHRAVIENHQAVIGRGGGLRLRLLTLVERYLDALESLADEGKSDALQSDDLKRCADLIDRLTASAEDRGGYPRAERREVGVTVENPLASVPDDDIDARMAEAEARFRVIQGGKE